MKVHFINVGYGDCIFLEIPSGRGETPFRVLVDTGSAKPEEYPPRGPRIRVTDYLRLKQVRILDLLVLTHVHEDHIAMTLPLLEQLTVREIWVNSRIPEKVFRSALRGKDVPEASFLLDSLALFGPILEKISREGIPLKWMEKKGENRKLGDSGRVRILANLTEEQSSLAQELGLLFDENGNVPICEKKVREELARLNRVWNAGSLGLLFQWEEFRVLLTGDSCPGNWPPALTEELSENPVHVFKLPHHGQLDSITPEAAGAISPSVAVTSSSSERRNRSSREECYRLIREICGEKTRFLFTDETDYPPFFRRERPFCAAVITLEKGREPGIGFCDYPDSEIPQA